MKQLSRRDFIRAFGGAAVGGMLAACQPSPEVVEKVVTVEVEKVVEQTVEVEKVVEKVVEVPVAGEERELLIHWRTNPEEVELFKVEWAKFMETHPNVKIQEIYTSWDEYDRKTDLLIAGGTPPCLWGPMAARGGRYYAPRGAFMVLDPFIERDNYDVSVFYPGTLPLCQWEGHWIGLPIDVWPGLLVYNKTLFDEAGVEYPGQDWSDKGWSWDALLERAQKLTKVEGDRTTQFGISGIGPDRMAFRAFGQSYFAREDFDVGYPQKFVGNNADFIDAMQYMYDMVETWGVAPTPAQTEALQAGAPSLFMTGKVAMDMFYPWNFGSYSEIQDFEWDLAALPWPAYGGHDLERFNFMFPDQYFIMKGCLAPAEAWELLKQLCSEEGQLGYPTAAGGMAARMSVAGSVFVQKRMEQTGLPEKSLQVVLDAAEIETASESHCFVNWQELWEKGIQPHFERVFLGELSAQEAAAQMETDVNRIIAETNPK